MTLTLEQIKTEVSPQADEIKCAWGDRLAEPGEMIQARGQLMSPDTRGFCCLGVLGLVLHEQFPEWLSDNGFSVQMGDQGMIITDRRAADPMVSSNTSLPNRLIAVLGMPNHPNANRMGISTVPLPKEFERKENSTWTLAGLNDDLSYDFPTICTIMRTYGIIPKGNASVED